MMYFMTRLQCDRRVISVSMSAVNDVNSLIASNGPSYSNTVIGTLAVDGWAVPLGTARRGLGGTAVRPGCTMYRM